MYEYNKKKLHVNYLWELKGYIWLPLFFISAQYVQPKTWKCNESQENWELVIITYYD